MPTAIQAPSVFNVEASLNAHFRTALLAITLPASLTGFTTSNITSMPLENEAGFPAISLYHIPVGLIDRWQGRNVGSSLQGMDSKALLDVSCWATRENNTKWLQQLRDMEDMILTVAATTTEIVIMDYATSPTAPSATANIVRLCDVVTRTTQPDPNPNIKRRRVLVEYEWIYRSS